MSKSGGARHLWKAEYHPKAAQEIQALAADPMIVKLPEQKDNRIEINGALRLLWRHD